MKYKIKISTFKNGRKLYQAYYKQRFNWSGLNYFGGLRSYAAECDSREDALKAIDKHFIGNSTIQTITFEFINK
jgi:hypothetical protein